MLDAVLDTTVLDAGCNAGYWVLDAVLDATRCWVLDAFLDAGRRAGGCSRY